MTPDMLREFRECGIVVSKRAAHAAGTLEAFHGVRCWVLQMAFECPIDYAITFDTQEVMEI